MKFILTKELGRLAKWLRILGFDAKYFPEAKESSLVIEALREDRVILTRNSRLGQHRGIKKLNINHNTVREQIRQLINELSIKLDETLMFSRCTICNELLPEISKESVKEKVPEYVFKTNSSFRYCPKCMRIYWQGTHWGNVRRCLEEIQANA